MNRRALVVLLGIAATLWTATSAASAAVHSGATCTRPGVISGAYVCAKSNQRLVWVRLKPQQISVSMPSSMPLASGAVIVVPAASSALQVTAVSRTTAVCRVRGLLLRFLSAGECNVEFLQAGNKLFAAASPVTRSLAVIGDNVLTVPVIAATQISAGVLTIAAQASSGLVPVARTNTSAVCGAISTGTIQLQSAGLCSVTWEQDGDAFHPAALPVTRTFAVMGDNILVADTPTTALLSSQRVTLSARASSGLAPKAHSETSDICTTDDSGQVTLRAAGLCRIVWEQAGDTYHPAALPVTRSFAVLATNTIEFTPPAQLRLQANVYSLAANATSKLPVAFSSSTSKVCTVSGTQLQLLTAGLCTVVASQSATGFWTAALSVSRTIEVVVGSRVTADQPDIKTGYQLHFVYVVPSDGTDHDYDRNGSIAAWIDEGQTFLKAQAGIRFPIDSTDAGYDISFLRSTSTSAQLAQYGSGLACSGADGSISRELSVNCLAYRGPDYAAIKHYVYLIDIPVIGSRTCGYAGVPGNTSVIVVGPGSGCTGSSSGFTSYFVLTWMHEVIHGLGVNHAPAGSCDLMAPSGGCSQTYLDRKHEYYVGSSNLGIDILKLPLWLRE